MIKRAVLNVFGRYFNSDDFSGLVARFDEGLMVEVGADVRSAAYANAFEALDDPAGLLRPLSLQRPTPGGLGGPTSDTPRQDRLKRDQLRTDPDVWSVGVALLVSVRGEHPYVPTWHRQI
jgi:hypothetical protein